MKKKNNGFTLVELLAVIVILGILMIVAIPNVSRIITQSKKETIITSISNYIGGVTNQVNGMKYTFKKDNTIYAVPIECISLERGGSSPFGKWHQANDAYWAYLLVQYNTEKSSYIYGFTFRDSAGYGMIPTTIDKIDKKGSQIKQNLELNRPKNGDITNILSKDKWVGFNVDGDIKLRVLEAESEGVSGNGNTTCTLCQKGDNYTQVEEEKDKFEEENPILPPEDERGIETASIYVTGGDYTINIEFKEGTTWAEFMGNKTLSYYNNYQFYRFGANYTLVGVSTYAMYLNDESVYSYDEIVKDANYVTGTQHVGGSND